MEELWITGNKDLDNTLLQLMALDELSATMGLNTPYEGEYLNQRIAEQINDIKGRYSLTNIINSI